MQIKRAVERCIVPTLERHEMKLIDSATGYYLFSTCDSKKQISFQKSKYPPSSFRVQYYFENCPPLFIERFDPSFNFCGSFTYQTQTELESGFCKMSYDADHALIELFEQLSDGFTNPTLEMYKELSRDTAEQAKHFACQHGLAWDTTNDIKVLRDTLLSIRPESISSRCASFQSHQAELIRLTAYLGELIRLNSAKELKWSWKQREEVVTPDKVFPAVDYFTLVYANDQIFSYSPLNMVLETWNFEKLLRSAGMVKLYRQIN